MASIKVPSEPIEPEPKWKKYEKVIAAIEKSYSDCTITHDRKIIGRRSQVERQVDVWLEAKVGHDHTVTVAVECRCYEDTPVAIKDIDAFYGFLDDTGANKGVIISNSGFTEGAKARADQGDIELKTLTFEEAEEFAWGDYLTDSCDAYGCWGGTIGWRGFGEECSEWGYCNNCGSFHIRCRNCGTLGSYNESNYVQCSGCPMTFHLIKEKGDTYRIVEIPPDDDECLDEDEYEESDADVQEHSEE